MEILFTALEEKKAELEELLLSIQRRKEQIKEDFEASAQGDAHNFTQDERTCLLFEELDEQQKKLTVEIEVLHEISAGKEEFEELRLAARNAHTSLLDEDSLSLPENEKDKLEDLSTREDEALQDTYLEYKRAKRIEEQGMSQEDILSMFIDLERRMAKHKMKRDLYIIMAEQLMNELQRMHGIERSEIEMDTLGH